MLHTQRSRHLCSPLPIELLPFPAIQTKPISTLSSLLNLCKKPQLLLQIHARFVLHGLHQNLSLSCKLIDSYANLGLLNISQQVFNSITDPNPILYNAMMRNLSKFGEYERTLLAYQEMISNNVYPDEETYPAVLKSCSCLLDVGYGKRVHGRLVKLGFGSSDVVGAALAEMYRCCGELGNEIKVLESNKYVNGSDYWNSLITETSENGNAEERFGIFGKMRMENLGLDSVTVINLMRSSVDLGSIKTGKMVHCAVVVGGLSGNLSVNTAILSMYSKLGSLWHAKLLFEKMPGKDSVAWNIMISAYSQNGCPRECLELLRCMVKSNIRADLFTAIGAVSSIRQLKSIECGKQMHAYVVRNGSDYQVSVHNAFIDMYCECDNLAYAIKIFDLVVNKTVVSWSSMIKGYVSHDRPLDAWSLFYRMRVDGVRVDFVTVINILPACVYMGALQQVKSLHGQSMTSGLNLLASVNTALLISYAKCGCIEMARKLFDDERIDDKDIITWNSMINAYAKHGDSSQCFELYNQMKELNLKLDPLTFLGLLTACVNSGLVKEGRELFKEMMETYCCEASQEHYACLVDLLGRAGHINEAREVVRTMPFKPDARVWGPLLSACKMHSETKLAEFAAEKVITMEPKNAGNYVLLSNIYAAAGKWDGVAKVRTFLRDKGLKKTPGCSWLEINGRVHEFHVADQSHPEKDHIYTLLGNLELEIKEAREKSLRKAVSDADFVHQHVLTLHV